MGISSASPISLFSPSSSPTSLSSSSPSSSHVLFCPPIALSLSRCHGVCTPFSSMVIHEMVSPSSSYKLAAKCRKIASTGPLICASWPKSVRVPRRRSLSLRQAGGDASFQLTAVQVAADEDDTVLALALRLLPGGLKLSHVAQHVHALERALLGHATQADDALRAEANQVQHVNASGACNEVEASRRGGAPWSGRCRRPCFAGACSASR